jgi:hypothetical protein
MVGVDKIVPGAVEVQILCFIQTQAPIASVKWFARKPNAFTGSNRNRVKF